MRSTGAAGGIVQLEQLARQRNCLPEVDRKRPQSVGPQTQTAHLLSLEIGCIACRHGLGHHPTRYRDSAYRAKVFLESELQRLGIEFKNSRPYHPQTCGKIERLHQTLKRYLARRPAARTLTELQSQLDTFAHYYNDIRPHRALDGRTPLQAYSARIKARPANQAAPDTHFRVRENKVDKTGTVTLRHENRLHHIGIGRAHKGRAIKLLTADRNIRIIDPTTSEPIRELTHDPTRDYQPTRQA